MKTELILFLTAAALIPLSTVAQDAAAEDIHIQASFYPYYDFTRNVAVSPDNVDLFLPLGVAAHDWEPSISKVESLQDTDVFVYNGLGIEEYLERLVESDDYDHITFVQASVGLDLISTTGLDEMIRGALEEYESGHYTTEEAVEAIKAILDTEEIREILVMYRSGDLTTTEALSRIQSLSGGGHAAHDDHGHDDHDAMEESGHDEHGHDEHDAMEESGHDDHDTTEAMEESGHDDHGHDDHDAMEESGHDEHGHDDHEGLITDIRGVLEEISDGDTSHEDGLEAIHDLVGSEEGDHGHEHAHDHGDFDPHVWLDPVLAKQQVLNIRDALIRVDSDNAETYRDNAAAYAAQLDELHSDYAATLTNCQHDTIVTFHEAFAYLVERYGFKTVSLSGISGTETVTISDITTMVDYVNENGINHLLGDDVLDARALETLADETDAEVLTLSPIEGISQEEFDAGVTYIGKMRENLTALKTALACQ